MSILGGKKTENINYVSPFDNDQARNFCSRQSTYITASRVEGNHIVQIELPHYQRCERIPLKKTPLYCSFNDTITFDESIRTGSIDLFRLKFASIVEERLENNKFISKTVAADMIDISISSKEDIELKEFWEKGRYLTVLDSVANIWLKVPTIEDCISDLKKLLYVYDCPKSKIEKRQQKLKALQKIQICNSSTCSKSITF